MWTAVHVAMARDQALEIEDKLSSMGFLVRLNYYRSEDGEDYYEISVPESESSDIQEAMMELGII